MKKFITLSAVLIILAGFSPATRSLLAQDQIASPPPPDSSQAPPQGQDAQADNSAQPGVARASFIHGDISMQRGDNGDLVPVTLNTPLEAGDRISTTNDGRAEIELDYADMLRLAGGATAKIAALSRQNIQVQVGQGLVTFSVLRGSEAPSEIDTPNASLHPQGQGDYRILVNSDAETKIIVRSGSADVSTPEGSTHVDAGQMITVAGTDNPQYRIDSAPGRDDWDAWNADRDRRVDTAQSYRDTNQYYTGSEDLDGYGAWSEVPDYGNVWFPSSGPDWAPYRDGSWVYEPYYGWTWVSYEPWGWAPYHYGRWFIYGGRWGWWPGPVYGGYRPIWGPAYVSFFGWGGGGFSFGFGGGWGRVGWLPIGPCDWYHPWYGRYGSRFTVINVHNTTVINNVHDGFGPLHGDRGRQFSNLHEAFGNDRMRAGISSMNGHDFGRQRVPTHQDRISDSSFRQSSMMTGRMPVEPSRASFSPTGHEANRSAFRNAPPSSQHFFTGNANRPGEAANSGGFRGVGNGNAREQAPSAADRNATHTMRQAPAGTTERAAPQSFGGQRPQQENGGRPGWHTFTPPSSANSNRPGSGPGPQGFGGPRGGNENRAPSGPANSGGNWRQFTPPTQGSQPGNENRGFSRPDNNRTFQPPAQNSQPGNENRGFSRPDNNRTFQPPAQNSQPGNENRGFSRPDNNRTFQPPAQNSQPGNENRGFSRPDNNRTFQPPAQAPQRPSYSQPRPTLNMQQPVVRPRSEPPSRSSAPRGGNFSPPRGGGSSAPRGGGSSAPRGSGGGGNGGGGSHGGGHHR